MEDRALAGGNSNSLVRLRGDIVYRKRRECSESVGWLLQSVSKGFSFCPVFYGLSGESEMVGYIPGTVGNYPVPTAFVAEKVLTQVASALRSLHVSTSKMLDSAAEMRWYQLPVAPSAATWDCIGHNDLGPYNVVLDESGDVAGFIDWDMAGPTNSQWDLAYAAYRLIPLVSPQVAMSLGFDGVDQIGRLKLFVKAYGGKVSEVQICEAAIARLAAEVLRIEVGAISGDENTEIARRENHVAGYLEDIGWIASVVGRLRAERE